MKPHLQIKLRYFASIREALGTSSEAYASQARSLGELRSELMARSSAYAEALAPGKAVRMALNQAMSEASATLSEGDEVAFFPPVTGG